MANNRNAQLRYQIIDECLQNRSRKWNWEDIVEKINEALIEENPKSKGIARSMFYKDMRDMETVIYKNRIEIERIREGRNVYFRYADPNASINKQLLTAQESDIIKNSVLVLSRFRGIPQFEWLNEIIPALESRFGLISSQEEILSFDNNLYYTGTGFIPPLFNAIHNRRVLKITYQDFKSPKAYDIKVHAQYLKQYNYRWFLFALVDEWPSKPSIYALDRIKNIDEIKGIYRDLENFDWDNYFSDIVGVTRHDKEPVEVKLLILDSEQAAYIETKPLHQTQKKLKKVEAGYILTIKVIPNYELIKMILSFGDRVQIISPLELRLEIKEIIKRMFMGYETTLI